MIVRLKDEQCWPHNDDIQLFQFYDSPIKRMHECDGVPGTYFVSIL